MTRKDYKAIASALNSAFHSPDSNGDAVCGVDIVDALVRVFQADNPRFDRSKFLEAVYAK